MKNGASRAIRDLDDVVVMTSAFNSTSSFVQLCFVVDEEERYRFFEILQLKCYGLVASTGASVFSSGGGDAASLPTADSDPGNWLLSPLAVEIHQNVGAGSALLILGHRILRITYLYNELSTTNLLHRHYDFKIHQKVYQKRFQFLVAYERNLQRTNELVKWVSVSLSAGLRHQLVQVLLLPHPRPPR
nr:hypothetical protein Iba_chr06dCG7430 [Ipomoea batatas]